MKITLSQIG